MSKERITLHTTHTLSRSFRARPVSLIAAGLLAALACSYGNALSLVTEPVLTMNPNANTPLAGEISVSTDEAASVSLQISNLGGDHNWTVTFPDSETDQTLPVLGFRPGDTYSVVVTASNVNGSVSSLPIAVVTDPLPADFPVIEVLTSIPNAMEPGVTMFRTTSGRSSLTVNPYAIVLDPLGKVVWYSSSLGASVNVRTDEGHITYVESGNTLKVIDLEGNEISSTALPVSTHHELHLADSGNFFSLSTESTVFAEYPADYENPLLIDTNVTIRNEPVVEFTPDGTLVNSWSLTDIIDPMRIGYLSLNNTPDGKDWIHTNAVFVDDDGGILVSARHQDAVIKFDSAGNLIWILGNHDNWGPAFQPYLLTPVGSPFAWQYHQHNINRSPFGTYVLFDNGNSRTSPFTGIPAPSPSYSRSVEFLIDEEAMTVEQVYEFGSAATFDETIYADFISGARRYPITGNVLTHFGGIRYLNGQLSSQAGYGQVSTRIIETDHEPVATRTRVFDVRVRRPEADAGSERAQTYRSERFPGLYADEVTVTYDSDNDGIADKDDNCTLVANAGQENADGDFFGDVCDAFPTNPGEWLDGDGDGIGNNSDNCPAFYNPYQWDLNNNGIGDECETSAAPGCVYNPRANSDTLWLILLAAAFAYGRERYRRRALKA